MPPPLCLPDQRVIDRRDAGTARLARRQQLEARRDAAEPNMPLKLYDTQDAVPEAQRANAIETKDGKFAIVEEDPQLADAGKRALDAERKRAKDAEDARKATEKELNDLKRKQDAADKGITEEQLAALRAEDEKKRKPIEDENASLKSKLRKMTLTDRIQALALKYGVMPDRIEDAMLALEKRTDLTDDGESIVVKDKAGTITSEKIEDFLAKTFKTEKPWLYSGSGASGSGAEGSNGSGGDTKPPTKESLDEKRAQVIGAL
jgi:hypothetical protein